MSLATATEYALMLAADPQPPAEEVRAGPGPAPAGAVRHGLTANEATAGLARLSPRERELVTLIAQGRTDAQIAAQLCITVRTVSSHLDRVRDKTGCRRRADLTRPALRAGLVQLTYAGSSLLLRSEPGGRGLASWLWTRSRESSRS